MNSQTRVNLLSRKWRACRLFQAQASLCGGFLLTVNECDEIRGTKSKFHACNLVYRITKFDLPDEWWDSEEIRSLIRRSCQDTSVFRVKYNIEFDS